MKSIRPRVVLAVGPIGLAVAIAIASWWARPSARHFSDIGWALLTGLVGGMVIFGPIAAALAISARHPDWWLRNAFRINFYTSFVMALCLGYFAACVMHDYVDTWGILAMVIMGLGAVIKIALGVAEPRKRQGSA